MFKDIYDNFLLEQNFQNQIKRQEEKTKGWLSISSAGSCYKKQYYLTNQINETNIPTAESLAKMRLGTILHNDFENAMSWAIDISQDNSDINYYTEWPVEIRDLKVEGTLDMAMHDKERGILYVGDLKSIGAYPYKLRFGRDKKKNRSKVSSNYELQVCTYAIALSNELEEPNVVPMLVFYNKDTSRIKTVEVPIHYMDEAQGYWEEVIDILEEMSTDMEDVEPNSMIGVPNADWECNYCNFKNRCHKEDV